MRTDPAVFREKNTAREKSPRHVIEIEFGPSNIERFASHSDITGIPGAPLFGAVQQVSGFSQRVQPEKGVSEIGQMSFRLIDEGGGVSTLLKTYSDAGVGLRDKTVRFWLGYEGLDFADFTLYQTQRAVDIRAQGGAYIIACADIQRTTKDSVFGEVFTNLTASIAADDTTIPVIDTSEFESFQNLASASDAPGQDVIYLKIENTGEVIRAPASGVQAAAFTNVQRGALGTVARAIEVSATQDERKPKLSHYVYLEMPAPLLAYGLLTGDLQGFGTLPSYWHLGIATADVAGSDFSEIGVDLFDPSDVTAGRVLRFEGIEEESAKQFIEEEIYRLVGLFPVIYSTGELGVKRAVPILADAAASVVLDESNVRDISALQHDFRALRNRIAIRWNWNGDTFTRRVLFTDANSISKHGNAQLMELEFRGLHGSRHTDLTIAQIIDTLRDRYSSPPYRLTARVFHSQNAIEIGDVVRVKIDNARDYNGETISLDRSFEVQQTAVNHQTGEVSLRLFGSTEEAQPYSPTQAATALPAGFWTSQGTDLSAVLTITGSPARVTANGSITGHPTNIEDPTAIYYYNGDLQIDAGVLVTLLNGNVQLRINGFLTINGELSGVGAGRAGVTVDPGDYDAWKLNPENWEGVAGYVGTTQPAGHMPSLGYLLGAAQIDPTPGKHDAFPFLDLTVDTAGNGSIAGLPADLRGGGGGFGGMYKQGAIGAEARGGAGGPGGAGLIIICKGLGFGASGKIELSGGDGGSPAAPQSLPSIGEQVYGGGGAGGGPGALLVLLDGSGVSVPAIDTGDFVSKTGAIPTPGTPMAAVQVNAAEDGFAGPYSPFHRGLGDVDSSAACLRIQYLPDMETPEEDEPGAGGPVNGLSVFVTYNDNARDNPPPTPTGDGNSGVWRLNPADLGGAVNWVSFKTAVSVDAGAWDLPILFTGDEGLPGAPGADGDPGVPGADGLSVVELIIYRRATSPPATPTGGSYEFGGAGLTPPSGWSGDIPAGTDPVYASVGQASIQGTTGTDSSITWSAPALVFQEGSAVDMIFTRSATQPATPAPSAGVPSGWYSDVNSVPPSTDLLWSSVGTRPDSGDNWTWQTPIQVEGEEGPQGPQGDPGADGADGFPRDLTPSDAWVRPPTDPMGGWGEFSPYGVANTSMNVNIAGPYGGNPYVLSVVGDGVAENQWKGRWQHDFAVDDDKTYVNYLWIRRKAGANGFLFGWPTTGAGSEVVEEAVSPYTPNTNPYAHIDTPTLPLPLLDGRWYLVVSVLHGNAYTLQEDAISGVYDSVTGLKVKSAYKYWRLRPGVTDVYFRWGFYDYNQGHSSAQGYDFIHAGTYEVTGAEPSIADLLSGDIALNPEFFDGFNYADEQQFKEVWDVYTGAGAEFTFPETSQTGGRVLRVDAIAFGADSRFTTFGMIPYSADKLYKMTCRVRLVTAPSNADDKFYAAIEGLDSDGITIIDTSGGTTHNNAHFHVALAEDLGTVGVGVWAEYVGYFTGLSATPANGPWPTKDAPGTLRTDIAYIRPLFIVNGPNVGDGVMDIDFVRIEIIDDDFGDLAGEDKVTESIAGTSASTTGVQVNGHASVGNIISVSGRATHNSFTNDNTAYTLRVRYRINGGAWTALRDIDESSPEVVSVEHVDEGGGNYTNSIVVDFGYTQPATPALQHIPGAGTIDYLFEWLTKPGGSSQGTFNTRLKTVETIL